jgi:hypothetical protein
MPDTAHPYGDRHIILSDFAGDRLAQARKERAKRHAQDPDAYRREMMDLVAIADAQEKKIAAAWANWRFFE